MRQWPSSYDTIAGSLRVSSFMRSRTAGTHLKVRKLATIFVVDSVPDKRAFHEYSATEHDQELTVMVVRDEIHQRGGGINIRQLIMCSGQESEEFACPEKGFNSCNGRHERG